MKHSTGKPKPTDPTATMHSVFSLLIALHLLIVGLSLICSSDRSLLQQKLGGILGIYSRSLCFVPERETYRYRYSNSLDGDTADDPHLVEIDIPAHPITGRPAVTAIFPLAGSNWSPDRHRRLRLTNLLGRYGDLLADDASAILAKEIAWQEMNEYDVDSVVVRCVRRMTQPLLLSELPSGYPQNLPDDPKYDRVVYAADITYVNDRLLVAKQSETREVAPRSNSEDAP